MKRRNFLKLVAGVSAGLGFSVKAEEPELKSKAITTARFIDALEIGNTLRVRRPNAYARSEIPDKMTFYEDKTLEAIRSGGNRILTSEEITRETLKVMSKKFNSIP